MLHDQALVGIDGREVAEAGAVAHLLGRAPVDALDPVEGRELAVVVAGGSHRAGHVVARTQAVLADELLVDEGVIVAGHVVARADEAVALVLYLEHALDGAEALLARRGEVDRLGEVLLADAHVLDAELRRLGAQLGDLHRGHVVAREAGLHRLLLTAVAALLVVATVAPGVAVPSLLAAVALAGLLEVPLVLLAATAAAGLALALLALVAGVVADLLVLPCAGVCLGGVSLGDGRGGRGQELPRGDGRLLGDAGHGAHVERGLLARGTHVSGSRRVSGLGYVRGLVVALLAGTTRTAARLLRRLGGSGVGRGGRLLARSRRGLLDCVHGLAGLSLGLLRPPAAPGLGSGWRLPGRTILRGVGRRLW